HAAHALKERRRETAIAEEVIVEKVEMPPRQAVDFRERVVHTLRVERSAALEEGDLVAEVAMLRASARDDDRVRHEVRAAADEVSPDWRYAVERPSRGRDIAGARPSGPVVVEESRERLLAGSQKDDVRVRRGLVRQRRDMQPAERDVDAPRAVRIGERVRSPRAGDVHLNHDQVQSIRVVGGRGALHVLVDDHGVVVRSEIGRQGSQAERREERVLDGPPVRARGFGQGGEDELHAQGSGRGHGHSSQHGTAVTTSANNFTSKSMLAENIVRTRPLRCREGSGGSGAYGATVGVALKPSVISISVPHGSVTNAIRSPDAFALLRMGASVLIPAACSFATNASMFFTSKPM